MPRSPVQIATEVESLQALVRAGTLSEAAAALAIDHLVTELRLNAQAQANVETGAPPTLTKAVSARFSGLQVATATICGTPVAGSILGAMNAVRSGDALTAAVRLGGILVYVAAMFLAEGFDGRQNHVGRNILLLNLAFALPWSTFGAPESPREPWWKVGVVAIASWVALVVVLGALTASSFVGIAESQRDHVPANVDGPPVARATPVVESPPDGAGASAQQLEEADVPGRLTAAEVARMMARTAAPATPAPAAIVPKPPPIVPRLTPEETARRERAIAIGVAKYGLTEEQAGIKWDAFQRKKALESKPPKGTNAASCGAGYYSESSRCQKLPEGTQKRAGGGWECRHGCINQTDYCFCVPDAP